MTNRSAGETIQETFFNSIHQALNGDMVGRDATGVPTAGQNLGTLALPWGTGRFNAIVLAGSTLDPSQVTAPVNRVTSGRTRSTSNQPAYIVPNGAALSLVIDGTPTSLVYDVNGTAVTLSADLTKSSLTAAPAANNTCLVNDTLAADQEETRRWGEPDVPYDITIDTVGSEISALVGKWAAFKLDNGSTTEMFLGFVESATKISKCFRGFFYDSTIAPQKRIVFSNNDTITLLKLGWIFLENDATTVDVTYTNPTIDFQSPGSPATGDYWYDLANQVWKRYDGAAFQIINRTLVGMFCNDTTACIGARSIDFYANYSADNTMGIVKSTSEIARAEKAYGLVSVAGRRIQFGVYLPTWNITTDLAAAADMYTATEQASTLYYLYLKDTGETVISDISPYYRDDMLGAYHPHNPWRCIGSAYNNASSNFDGAGRFDDVPPSEVYVEGANGQGSTNTAIRRYTSTLTYLGRGIVYADSSTLGASFTVTENGLYSMSLCDGYSVAGAASMGISKNSTQLTTGVAGITAADRIAGVQALGGSEATQLVSAVVALRAGDIIRPHSLGDSASSVQVAFRIAKIRDGKL